MLTLAANSPDVEHVRKLLAHIPGAADKALSRAVNRAIESAKTEALRAVRERYTLRADEFRKSVKVIKATPQKPTAMMITRGAPLRVAKFKVSPRPTTSEIIAGRVRVWPHGFLERVGKHEGLFTRAKEHTIPTKGSYAGRKKTREGTRGISRSAVGAPIRRQKLSEATTISAAQMVCSPEILNTVLDLAAEKLEQELARQVELFLSGQVS